MLSKISNKLRIKRSVTTVTALSILLGAQVAAFADLNADFNYGYDSAVAGINANFTVGEVITYYLGRCSGHYSTHADINECDYGGRVALSANG